jgi:hypothetical protein
MLCSLTDEHKQQEQEPPERQPAVPHSSRTVPTHTYLLLNLAYPQQLPDDLVVERLEQLIFIIIKINTTIPPYSCLLFPACLHAQSSSLMLSATQISDHADPRMYYSDIHQLHPSSELSMYPRGCVSFYLCRNLYVEVHARVALQSCSDSTNALHQTRETDIIHQNMYQPRAFIAQYISSSVDHRSAPKQGAPHRFGMPQSRLP